MCTRVGASDDLPTKSAPSIPLRAKTECAEEELVVFISALEHPLKWHVSAPLFCDT